MLDFLLASALLCEEVNSNYLHPELTTIQHYQVQNYIVTTLAKSGNPQKETIDGILGLNGCLYRLEGSSQKTEVYHWKGENRRLIEAKWREGRFVNWKGQGF